MDRSFAQRTGPQERHALILMAAVFALCGLSAVMNTILVPYLRTTLGIGYRTAALVDTSYYLAYFLVSPVAGAWCRRHTFRQGIVLGAALAVTGPLLLCTTGFHPHLPIVLIAIFLLGSGVATIQVSGNPYVMSLGSKTTTSARLSLVQSMTNLGTVLAPYLGARLLLRSLHTSSLATPYLLLTAAWIAITALLWRLPFSDTPSPHSPGRSGHHPLTDSVVLAGIIGIALCVGVEVTTASFLISFLSMPTILDLSKEHAGYWCTLFWLGFMGGRLVGAAWLRVIAAETILFIHAAAGALLAMLGICTSGAVAAAAVLALGLCTSIMFPVIFSLVIGRCTACPVWSAGYLCMANIGGALMPLIQGSVADTHGIQASFTIASIAFLALAMFAGAINPRLRPNLVR